MALLKLEGGSRQAVIETAQALDTDEPRVRQLDLLLAAQFSATNLEWLRVEPTGNAREWLYRFKHVDGRMWRQVIHVPAGNLGGAHMNFDTDAWTIEEFIHQRELRAHIIAMLDVDLISVDVESA